jgi:hypothetical protein
MTNNTHFTTAVESIDAAIAGVGQLFGNQNRQISSQRPRQGSREAVLWEAGLLRAEQFMTDIRTGRRDLWQFREAMSSSDFPGYFLDSLDRQLYGSYEAVAPTWQKYARAATVNDFREVKRFASSGIRGILPKVKELAEFERRAMDEAEYGYSVERYEAGFALSFEMMLNDDLNMFFRMPQDLADSARDSEENYVTRLFCGASGPITPFYSSGNVNLVPGNPSLSRESLQQAITILMKRKDDKGNPIQIKGIELVTGTGNSLEAEEIINATEYRSVNANGDITMIKGNGVAANLRHSTNLFIDSVAVTANADTSWWIFASPSGPRPAIEFGRLRGFEQPSLYEKIPDTRRVGGGEVPWSFDTSSAEKKVQHIFGGSMIDPKMTVASNGSNS